jgi:hypothetical protein
MDIKETLSITGALTIVKTNELGVVTEKVHVPNLVVTVGKTFIASRMAGTASAVMSHMGVGIGTVAAAVGDTALGSALGANVALTSSTASSNTVTYVATFGAGVSTGAITEAGIFNALTAGTMLCRTVFPVVNKAAGDSITITWVVTVS